MKNEGKKAEKKGMKEEIKKGKNSPETAVGDFFSLFRISET